MPRRNANGDIYLVGTKDYYQVSKSCDHCFRRFARTNASLWALGQRAGLRARLLARGLRHHRRARARSFRRLKSLSSRAHLIRTARPRWARRRRPRSLTSHLEVYAVRLVPFAKKKLNIDAGCCTRAGFIDNPVERSDPAT